MIQKGGAEVLLLRFVKMVPNIDFNDRTSNNMLHYLVSTGEYNLVKQFLKIADKKNQLYLIIDSFNEDNLTPLHIAVKNNFQKIAELLILYGASKDIPDNNGQKVVWVPDQVGGGKRKIIYGKRYI